MEDINKTISISEPRLPTMDCPFVIKMIMMKKIKEWSFVEQVCVVCVLSKRLAEGRVKEWKLLKEMRIPMYLYRKTVVGDLDAR